MALMGRKRSRDEYEAEEEQPVENPGAEAQEVMVEEVLEEEIFEAKEPWVVRGETWLQAVKLEKQVSCPQILMCKLPVCCARY